MAATPGLALDRRGKPERSLKNCLIIVRQMNLGLAFNELTQMAVIRAERLPWVVDVGREVTDDVFRFVRYLLIERTGIEFSKSHVQETCLTLARSNPFDPVTEYLATLTWDGRKRIDNWLTRYLGADDNEYVRAVGRLFLVAAVRRARNPGCKFDTVLILEGPQGSGKSRALKILGGEWFSDGELGRLDNKDSALNLLGVWIQELGELAAMSRGEIEDQKAFVSRPEDRYRPPYGRVSRTFPRHCVFAGTTNQSGYLTDMTGNRRYWPVKTSTIDLEALTADRDQLWAEAAQIETIGESITLAEHLWPVAEAEQADRLVSDPWMDDIRLWLETSGTARVHTSRLYDVLKLEPHRRTTATAQRVRRVMASINGWTYTRGLRIGDQVAAGYLNDLAEAEAVVEGVEGVEAESHS